MTGCSVVENACSLSSCGLLINIWSLSDEDSLTCSSEEDILHFCFTGLFTSGSVFSLLLICCSPFSLSSFPGCAAYVTVCLCEEEEGPVLSCLLGDPARLRNWLNLQGPSCDFLFLIMLSVFPCLSGCLFHLNVASNRSKEPLCCRALLDSIHRVLPLAMPPPLWGF